MVHWKASAVSGEAVSRLHRWGEVLQDCVYPVT